MSTVCDTGEDVFVRWAELHISHNFRSRQERCLATVCPRSPIPQLDRAILAAADQQVVLEMMPRDAMHAAGVLREHLLLQRPLAPLAHHAPHSDGCPTTAMSATAGASAMCCRARQLPAARTSVCRRCRHDVRSTRSRTPEHQNQANQSRQLTTKQHAITFSSPRESKSQEVDVPCDICDREIRCRSQICKNNRRKPNQHSTNTNTNTNSNTNTQRRRHIPLTHSQLLDLLNAFARVDLDDLHMVSAGDRAQTLVRRLAHCTQLAAQVNARHFQPINRLLLPRKQ